MYLILIFKNLFVCFFLFILPTLKNYIKNDIIFDVVPREFSVKLGSCFSSSV